MARVGWGEVQRQGGYEDAFFGRVWIFLKPFSVERR